MTQTPPVSFYVRLTHSSFLPSSSSFLAEYSLAAHHHSPGLECSLSFFSPLAQKVPHVLCNLLPTALSSDLASLWQTPSIPSRPPSLYSRAPTCAWDPHIQLSHVRHKETTQTPPGSARKITYSLLLAEAQHIPEPTKGKK